MHTTKTLNVAKIAVDINLNKYYDYEIPSNILDLIKVGTHVNVDFNKRIITGCVIEITDKTEFRNKLKKIDSISTVRPAISPTLLSLAKWMADYYCCSKEEAVKVLLPGVIRSGKTSQKNLFFISLDDAKSAAEYLFKTKNIPESHVKILEYMIAKVEVSLSTLKSVIKCSDSPINTLLGKGILIKSKKQIDRLSYPVNEIVRTEPHDLTDEQADVLTEINGMILNRSEYFVALLYGITGSGKTEIYLQAIEHTIKLGKEAIVLVPEISLTPQTTERFRSRFGDMVSVLHSGLSDGERFDEWTKVYQGKVKIVVGARSALFAPFSNLGLIVVDEEHEQTYKQEESPRYNARDMAVMRGSLEEAVVILGSATPSFESFYNAAKGKYKLLKLTKRVEEQPMPEIKLIDMRCETTDLGHNLFSKDLVRAVYEKLNKKEQTIIFLNRRGFASHMTCPSCGYTASCSSCSIDYTYHKSKNLLSCHLCGSLVEAPRKCPKCNSPEIKYSGTGTEKIELIASKLFPSAKIARMDSDTMRNKNSYEKILTSFKRREIDILVGTQMLAKGLDFPNVTLVGVINADISLHMPDFRASEKTFQILTQVSGRAGRGSAAGEVYIQTYTPFHYAIQAAVSHDYHSFYENEIVTRKILKYPPEGHLLVIRFIGENEDEVKNSAQIYYDVISKIQSENIIISPVVPSPISKIKNRYRYMIIMRGNINNSVKLLLANTLKKIKKNKVRITLDVDAVNLS